MELIEEYEIQTFKKKRDEVLKKRNAELMVTERMEDA